MAHTSNYSFGNTEITLVTDKYEIEINTVEGNLCVISKEDRAKFLDEIRRVIEKYAI